MDDVKKVIKTSEEIGIEEKERIEKIQEYYFE